MARYAPQSQTRDVMHRKAQIARELLARGLSIRQIKTQLNCSATFVERVRTEADVEHVLRGNESTAL